MSDNSGRGNTSPSQLARQLADLWQQGKRPDVQSFLADAGEVEPTDLGAVLSVDQRQRWQHGERVTAEDYLRRHPEIQNKPEQVLELISSEFQMREELGDSPSEEEYLRRFPHYATQLSEQLQRQRSAATPETQWPRDPGEVRPPRDFPVSPPQPAQESGSVVANYEILAELSRGGMGVVYKARQRGLNRLVALKMILRGEHSSKADLERFQREAQAAAALDHPNIVPIYESGWQDGRPYFTMAFIEGPSLLQRVRAGSVKPAEAARLTRGAAEGVAYAHSRNILHRDLKPHNILLDTQGRPRVADFGLARRVDEGERLTMSGEVMGTPSYMAPEQALGNQSAIGPATDIYGLGAILYHLLTGQAPFVGGNTFTLLQRVVSEPPTPPRRLNPAVPEGLEAVCLRCLEKDATRRYASALELVEALTPWTQDDKTERLPSTPPAENSSTGSITEVPETAYFGSSPSAADSVPASAPTKTPEETTARKQQGSPRRGVRPLALLAGLGTGVLVGVAVLVFVLLKWHPGNGSGALQGEAPSATGAASHEPPTIVQNPPEGAGPGEKVEAVVFPPPPLRHDFDVTVELLDSQARPDGVRLLTEGECILRLTSARATQVGVYSVAADGTVHQLLPNDFEPDNRLEANVPREIPARRLREEYSISLTPSAGVEQLRVLATTGKWPDLQGRKDGPFLAFRDTAERDQLRNMREMVVKPKVHCAEVMVSYFVEKAHR